MLSEFEIGEDYVVSISNDALLSTFKKYLEAETIREGVFPFNVDITLNKIEYMPQWDSWAFSYTYDEQRIN